MARVISLIGFQPSAIAVALKTWAAATGQTPAQIALLATRAVLDAKVPHRLVRDLRTLFPSVQGSIIPISNGLVADAHGPPAADAARRWLAEAGTAAAAPVLFCADPGPKFLVVSLAQMLPPDGSRPRSSSWLMNEAAGSTG